VRAVPAAASPRALQAPQERLVLGSLLYLHNGVPQRIVQSRSMVQFAGFGVDRVLRAAPSLRSMEMWYHPDVAASSALFLEAVARRTPAFVNRSRWLRSLPYDALKRAFASHGLSGVLGAASDQRRAQQVLAGMARPDGYTSNVRLQSPCGDEMTFSSVFSAQALVQLKYDARGLVEQLATTFSDVRTLPLIVVVVDEAASVSRRLLSVGATGMSIASAPAFGSGAMTLTKRVPAPYAPGGAVSSSAFTGHGDALAAGVAALDLTVGAEGADDSDDVSVDSTAPQAGETPFQQQVPRFGAAAAMAAGERSDSDSSLEAVVEAERHTRQASVLAAAPAVVTRVGRDGSACFDFHDISVATEMFPVFDANALPRSLGPVTAEVAAAMAPPAPVAPAASASAGLSGTGGASMAAASSTSRQLDATSLPGGNEPLLVFDPTKPGELQRLHRVVTAFVRGGDWRTEAGWA